MPHRSGDPVRFWPQQRLLGGHQVRSVIEQHVAHGFYPEISTASQLKRRWSHAFSVLLNLALLMTMRAFPSFACLRISVPICSPSRSQSVQIKRALHLRACSWMFFAIATLSCRQVLAWGLYQTFAKMRRYTYVSHRLVYWSFEEG